MSVENYFTDDEKRRIKEAIAEAELDTSGEIRLHVEGKCKIEVLDRAAYVFEKLGMHETELRNGVLFYLAVYDHKFAIIGDRGINKLVPENYWDEIKKTMLGYFSKGAIADGLVEGFLMAGQQLKSNFPYLKDDINELSDEISFEKNL